MGEEHRCEGHRLCANRCGFFGSSATMNLCSKCYRGEEQHASVETSTSTAVAPPEMDGGEKRCSACGKRVGLTGFRCRCGTTFCGAHRYPEKHACAFDFKRFGREEIARANPIVKADKLRRI